MPYLLAKTIGFTDGFLTVHVSSMIIVIWANNAVTILSLQIMSMESLASMYKIATLTHMTL